MESSGSSGRCGDCQDFIASSTCVCKVRAKHGGEPRTPAGIFELIMKAVDVTGKLGLHDQPTGTDDVWAKAREVEEQRARK